MRVCEICPSEDVEWRSPNGFDICCFESAFKAGKKAAQATKCTVCNELVKASEVTCGPCNGIE